MEIPFATVPRRQSVSSALAWLPTAALLALLWVPVAPALGLVWHSDPAVSHGPLMVALAAGHLWLRRKELRSWRAACLPGLALAICASLAYVGAAWTDVVFAKSLSLIAAMVGTIWFLAGPATLRSSLGPLGFLAFMIPWPITLSTRLSFPLQLMSSAYGAMLAGIAGVPVVRNGIQLAVAPETGSHLNAMQVTVAEGCNGLTSIVVLLALGYLIAYHTPIRLERRALMVASVVPLALLANAVRIALVLIVGTYVNRDLGMKVHDHEAPVLIFFCSLGLIGLRSALMARTPSAGNGGNGGAVSPPAAHS